MALALAMPPLQPHANFAPIGLAQGARAWMTLGSVTWIGRSDITEQFLGHASRGGELLGPDT